MGQLNRALIQNLNLSINTLTRGHRRHEDVPSIDYCAPNRGHLFMRALEGKAGRQPPPTCLVEVSPLTGTNEDRIIKKN